MMYIMLSSYMMVSLITATICDALVTAAREDSEHKKQEIEKGRSELEKNLKELFQRLDNDKNGKLTKDEITDALVKDKDMSDRLVALEIHMDEDEVLELFD